MANGPVPDLDIVPDTPSNDGQRIASELDLERFATLPVAERVLTEPLRFVLVETALTGVIRYNWSLLRPLVEYLTEQTLRDYEAAAAADGPGPSRPAFPGEGLGATIDRFKAYLGRFSQAPWTLQRLCEVLLAPQTQYSRLHKVALAIEKCLVVTSEVQPAGDPPPLPTIHELSQRPVNCPAEGLPKAPSGPVMHHAGAGPADMEGSAAFTNTLLDVHGSPPGMAAGPGVPLHGGAAGSSAQPGMGPHSNSNSTNGVGGVHAVGPAGHGNSGPALPAVSMAGTGLALPPVTSGAAGPPMHHAPAAPGAHGSGPGAGAAANHHGHHHHSSQHQHSLHHHGSHGQGSPGAGISALEHMEEDHWPDASTRPGLPPLHGLAGHHLGAHHAPPGHATHPHGSHSPATVPMLPVVHGPHRSAGSGGSSAAHGAVDSPRPALPHAKAGLAVGGHPLPAEPLATAHPALPQPQALQQRQLEQQLQDVGQGQAPVAGAGPERWGVSSQATPAGAGGTQLPAGPPSTLPGPEPAAAGPLPLHDPGAMQAEPAAPAPAADADAMQVDEAPGPPAAAPAAGGGVHEPAPGAPMAAAAAADAGSTAPAAMSSDSALVAAPAAAGAAAPGATDAAQQQQQQQEQVPMPAADAAGGQAPMEQ